MDKNQWTMNYMRYDGVQIKLFIAFFKIEFE